MYKLYVANKNYSSWSLRSWLLLRALDIPFDEQMVSLNTNAATGSFREFSPSGRVPCLVDGDVVVWDSLAIAEYVAERHPGVWPDFPKARAWARSVAAEMHSGFGALRNEMAMCIKERVDVRPWSPALNADIARVEALWAETRRRYGNGGPYLCGRFSAADAFFGPVAFRFQTYGVQPAGAAGEYLQALLAHPAMREWEAAALAETEVVERDEPRLIYRDKLAGK